MNYAERVRMKRSEAVSILLEAYQESVNKNDNMTTVFSDVLKAAEEKIWKTPPRFTWVFATGKEYDPKTDQGRDIESRWMWENENEKK